MIGVAVPTEAAAVGAIGTIAMTVCYKTFTLRVMFDAMIKTLSVTAMILTIVVGGTMFASVFYHLAVLTLFVGSWNFGI